jgi:hypothetical protein
VGLADEDEAAGVERRLRGGDDGWVDLGVIEPERRDGVSERRFAGQETVAARTAAS